MRTMKCHLEGLVETTTFTFEEQNTVLTQVERCLNSRPIISLSNDPNDLTYLSPEHFLTGASLISFPDPTLSDVSLLSLLQNLQRTQQLFWKTWSTDYLNSLQQRGKCASTQLNLNPGAVVLVNEAVIHHRPGRWQRWWRYILDKMFWWELQQL